MNKIFLSIIFIGLVGYSFAQDINAKIYYDQAFDELYQMLNGEKPLSFKRAVFITENAYTENLLSYDEFLFQIDALVKLTKAVATSDELLDYSKKDRDKVLLASAIYRVMKDSLHFQSPDNKVSFMKIPFTYDMDDFSGKNDWTKMFVSKLLYEQTGNCHSLPALYKILADELSVDAWLAITPNHAYIKQWSDKTGWYNTELTTGRFPYDAEIKYNSYIKTEAIADGVYMDTLSRKETIAYVINDLAQGYVKKFGYTDIATPVKWLDTALVYYRDYPNALILESELLKKGYEKAASAKGEKDFLNPKNAELKKQFESLEKSYYSVHQIGYRRMPKEMYLNWLYRVRKDTTRKPYKFESPQPFKQYNYNVKMVTAGDGENYEFFDQEETTRIGTVEINRLTGKIIKFIEPEKDDFSDEIISRSYDPAIGRFWQIDPVADKFTGITPYNYCANNPVLLNDPNGADWAIDITKDKKGNWQVSITFTGAVLNSSGRKINVTNYIKQQGEQFSKIFGGEKNGKNVAVNFNVRSIDSKNDLKSNEHLIEIQDRKNFKETEEGTEGGNAAYGGKYISINEKYINDDGSVDDERDLSHEIGHTGGLWHPFQMDANPSTQRFANGRIGRNDSQRDVSDDLSNNYDYVNNFMTYLMNAKNSLHTDTRGESTLKRNPGKATIGQIWQIWSNYKRGDLNYNDVPKK